MGHTNHLTMLTQCAQLQTHNFGHSTADTHINLIENQSRDARRLCSDDLNRQTNTGQLAAGSDFV